MLFAYFATRFSLLNIALNLLKEYNPKLWNVDKFPLIYIINCLIIPGYITHVAYYAMLSKFRLCCYFTGVLTGIYYGLFNEDIGLSGGGYSCFPSVERKSYYITIVSPTAVLLLSTMITYHVTFRSARSLFDELREAGLWKVFELNIQNNIFAMISVYHPGLRNLLNLCDITGILLRTACNICKILPRQLSRFCEDSFQDVLPRFSQDSYQDSFPRFFQDSFPRFFQDSSKILFQDSYARFF